jgi:CRISPR-associated exonuclease Cas4
MEYKEEDFLQLSGLQHFIFCRRQWALVHIEQQWEDNERTAIGEIMHKRTHNVDIREKRGDTITVRAMRIRSFELGISGECDVVEFHRAEKGVQLQDEQGTWEIYPVEYKKGKQKSDQSDSAQLCAQAMCLEEMFCTEIKCGALYYGEIRRRESVKFTEDLRNLVKDTIKEMHQDFKRGYTPKAKRKKCCNACSLKDICLPEIEKKISVSQYMKKAIQGENR